MNGESGVGGVILIGMMLAIYLVPSLIAASRQHINAGAIFALNLFLGWTLLGWGAALVWAVTAQQAATGPPAGEVRRYGPATEEPRAEQSAKRDIAGEIDRLAALREKGALSEDEFQRLKEKAISGA